MQIFIQKIRQARLMKGLSQENVAFELGISQSAYSKLEKGQTTIGFFEAIRLAKILDIDLLEVLKEALSLTSSNKN